MVNVDKAYRYDPGGELAESWDQTRGRTQYAYDPVGQLLSMVPEKARPEFFRYDPAGNLYENDPNAAERVYGRGNRLLRKGDTEYRWDDDGRLIEKRRREGEKEEVWRYEWNAAGLLKEVERPDGVRVGFAYDPFARRVSKRVTRAGKTRFDRIAVSETRFVWDGDVLAHEVKRTAEQNGNPVVEERTYWFEDDGFEPVGHREKAGWFHYVNDPIGTPERLIAENGEIAGELQRTAWGQTEEAPGSKASTKIRFQGQYEDEETGLRYNRFRYYDAVAGRFVSADPIGLAGGPNNYAYPPNPNGITDPYGLARTAKKILRDVVGRIQGRPQADVANELRAKGFRECTATSGGSVFTKTATGGETAAVRLDPPDPKAKAGHAGAMAHAHKEIVPTSAVTDGNYSPSAVTVFLNDRGHKQDRSTDAGMRASHIPTG